MKKTIRFLKLTFSDNMGWMIWPFVGWFIMAFFGMIVVILEGIDTLNTDKS